MITLPLHVRNLRSHSSLIKPVTLHLKHFPNTVISAQFI